MTYARPHDPAPGQGHHEPTDLRPCAPFFKRRERSRLQRHCARKQLRIDIPPCPMDPASDATAGAQDSNVIVIDCATDWTVAEAAGFDGGLEETTWSFPALPWDEAADATASDINLWLDGDAPEEHRHGLDVLEFLDDLGAHAAHSSDPAATVDFREHAPESLLSGRSVTGRSNTPACEGASLGCDAHSASNAADLWPGMDQAPSDVACWQHANHDLSPSLSCAYAWPTRATAPAPWSECTGRAVAAPKAPVD